ncbi:MAG: type restriction endonuclease subunit [Firmicutes bacterium]|nr:type restriction endonuclease subunit [Bacillota bacterium]
MMSGKENNVPKRRFKEFKNADAWEQRKLGEIAAFSKGRGYSKSDLTEVGTPIILYGRLYTKYQNVISAVDTLAVDKPGSVYSSGNEVIVPASGETAKDIARASVVEKPGVLLGGDLNIVSPNDDVDSVFLALSLSNGEQQKELAKKAQGKSVVHLHNADLQEVELSYPFKQEQVEISRLFRELDSIITLHQRKLEKMKALKKAYLTNMFPAEGERKPKLRFAGFTDNWEQCKLSEIATMKARIGWQGLTQKEFLDEGDYYLITGTDFDNGQIDFSNCHYISKERYNQDANIQVKNGDVLITKDGTIGKVAYIRNMDKPATLNAGVFVIKGMDKSVSNLCLYHYLAAPFLLDYADKQATGGTIKHLNQNVLVNFPIPLPKVKEQKEIGQLFSQLDNLITLHQRKLNKLQNIKKAYLNEMFI